jgi:hypothetical protein
MDHGFKPFERALYLTIAPKKFNGVEKTNRVCYAPFTFSH